MSIDSKTFCIMPFIHQNIKHEGKLSACWRYPDRLGDYRTEPLDEIWNNETTRGLRKALLNGEKPNGCRSCWDFEQTDEDWSTRRAVNKQYVDDYDMDYEEILRGVRDDYSMDYTPKTIEMRFDNTCNLRCRHCGPAYSSLWENLAFQEPEIKKFFADQGMGRLEKKHMSLPEDRFQDFMKKAIPHLQEVLIAGGEPLLQKRHFQMLEKMQPYAKKIRLGYDINGMQLGFGKWNALDLWKPFKEIELRISMDGYTDTYEYFRVNGKIDVVEKNIKKIINSGQLISDGGNIRFNISTTVCIYNITRLVDCMKYVTKQGALFHTSTVQYPEAINPRILPKELKEETTRKYNEFIDNVENEPIWDGWSEKSKKEQIRRFHKNGKINLDYMNSVDTSNNISDMWEYIALMDKHSNTNFFDVYPEFKRFAT